jgi:hypothetical protein
LKSRLSSGNSSGTIGGEFVKLLVEVAGGIRYFGDIREK